MEVLLVVGEAGGVAIGAGILAWAAGERGEFEFGEKAIDFGLAGVGGEDDGAELERGQPAHVEELLAAGFGLFPAEECHFDAQGRLGVEAGVDTGGVGLEGEGGLESAIFSQRRAPTNRFAAPRPSRLDSRSGPSSLKGWTFGASLQVARAYTSDAA